MVAVPFDISGNDITYSTGGSNVNQICSSNEIVTDRRDQRRRRLLDMCSVASLVVIWSTMAAKAVVVACSPAIGLVILTINNSSRKLIIHLNSFIEYINILLSLILYRTEAYTCWSTNTGGEMFNFGSRIDHILSAGSCLHEDKDLEGHNFFSCHVKDCDILTQFKRWKPGTTPSYRWKGGGRVKLEGSDHAPVFMSLVEIPDIQLHNTPPLSTRYCPQVRGCQQTLVSLLSKRQSTEEVKFREQSDNSFDEEIKEHAKRNILDGSEARTEIKKKLKKNQSSQLSLKSFFQSTTKSKSVEVCETEILESEFNKSELDQPQSESDGCISSESDKSKVALLEWQRIQEFMQKSIPVCKGHGEQCVSRVVKKAGPTFGRRFYVCARAEGPTSNPEANCGYFSWADSRSKRKQGK